MQTPLSIGSSSQLLRNGLRCILGVSFIAASLFLVAGCGSGGKDAKDQVTGKVTLDGKPVSGVVSFVFGDKEISSPIGTDGTYQIISPPTGTNKIYVKGGLGAGAPTVKGEMPKSGAPEMPKLGGDSTGVAPPTKYGAVTTSGLTFEVKGGKQTYDIVLTP